MGPVRKQLLVAEPAVAVCRNRRCWLELLLLSSTAGYAPPVRSLSPSPWFSPEPRSQGPFAVARASLSVSVKPAGWVSRRSTAACARQLLPCSGSGTVTTGGCGTQGGRGSADRLGDRRALRDSLDPATSAQGMHAGACRGARFPREQRKPLLQVILL